MANAGAITTLITDLNNDCLRQIFLHVPVGDRIKLRRVCKRFREIVDDCWRTVRTLKILDTTESAVGRSRVKKSGVSPYRVNEIEKGLSGIHDFIGLNTSNQKLIEGILKRCGEFITRLCDYRDDKVYSVLPLATKYCRKLAILSIDVTSKAEDKQLNQLLAVNTKLKVLHLDTNFKNIKVCLRSIPTELLEELCIRIYGIKPPPLILTSQKQIVRQARFLERLNLNTFDDELVELIGKKPQLEALVVETRNADYLTRTGLKPILHLENLRELHILSPRLCGPVRDQVPVDDDFLTTLSENLQLLGELRLAAPAFVTDKGFAKLASLPNLRYLTIVCCEGITDRFLILFDKIEMLGLIRCNIRDEGVIKFLEKSQTIRELNLEFSHITNKSLDAAVQATKKRDNGRHLLFYISNTKTAPEKLTQTSPLLKFLK